MDKLEFKIYSGKINQLVTKKEIEIELRSMHKKYSYRMITGLISDIYIITCYLHLLGNYMKRGTSINLPDFILIFAIRKTVELVELVTNNGKEPTNPILSFIDLAFPIINKLSSLHPGSMNYYNAGVRITQKGFMALAKLQGTDDFTVPPRFKITVPYGTDWIIIDKLLLTSNFSYNSLSVIAEFAKLYLPKLDKPYPLIERYLTETSAEELAKELSTIDKKTIEILTTFT